jgi:hypothetical protein
MPGQVINNENIERLIRELVAIKDFDRVREERDDAREKLSQLETKTNDYEEIKRQREEAASHLIGLQKQSIETITQIVEQLGKPSDQRHYDKILQDSDLPKIIEDLIERSVVNHVSVARSRELSENFKAEVEAQVRYFKEFWPTVWIGIKTNEKVRKLEEKQFDDPFLVLRGDWKFLCEKCHFHHTLKLYETSEIAEVLRRKYVDVPVGRIYSLATGNHSTRATLEDLVGEFLRQGEYS